jgi:hypothetical protein
MHCDSLSAAAVIKQLQFKNLSTAMGGKMRSFLSLLHAACKQDAISAPQHIFFDRNSSTFEYFTKVRNQLAL